jgi:hypothetical protein
MNRNPSTRPLLIGFVSVVAVGSPAPQKPTENTRHITTIVHHHDPLPLRSDVYNGADQATYSAALNANVTSYIGPNGRLEARPVQPVGPHNLHYAE